MTKNNRVPSLLSVRTTLILLAALQASAGMAGLTYIGTGDVVGAVIAAVTTFGVTIVGLHNLVDTG